MEIVRTASKLLCLVDIYNDLLGTTMASGEHLSTLCSLHDHSHPLRQSCGGISSLPLSQNKPALCFCGVNNLGLCVFLVKVLPRFSNVQSKIEGKQLISLHLHDWILLTLFIAIKHGLLLYLPECFPNP